MTHRYLLALFLLVNTARAQAPIVTARTPVRNALVAPRTADVALTFSQPIDATTASAIAVYPAQSGRKAGVYTTAGNTVNFNPTTDFKAGEKVVVSVPATVRGTNAVAAARQVHEFTTAVAGTGVGNFRLGANTYTGTAAREVATGDVDGDGDVDFVNGNQYGGSGVYVNRNGGNAAGTNTGVFTTTQTVAIVDQPFDLALGDADGDGDLDLFVATSELQVWLNGGNASGSNTGQFSAPAFVNVGLGARSVALGDVDGDGDLDAVVASGNGTAFIVRLNGGNATGSNTGVFSNGGTYTVGYSIVAVALGDVDGDGDLDVLSTISGSSGPAVSVSINGGNAAGSNTGVFTLSQSVRLGGAPEDVVLGDVDGDLDLDFVTTSGGSVAVSLNGGDATGSNTGVFGAVRYVAGISGAFCVTLGDLDADGDLDLLASQPSYIGAGNTVYARLNGGDATGSNTGVFSGGYSAVAGLMTYKIALADLDGDLDLDLLAVNYDSNTVSVRFNQPPPPVLTSVSPSSGVAGTVVTVTGTNLTGATLVVNGRPATAGGNTGTSFAFVVPTGATATGNLVVTTPGGVATVAFAVQLAITSTSPAANGRNASRTSSPFRATFTEPITTNSAGNLRVFSAQSGGSKSGTATSVGNNVSFAATNGTPRTNFQPGEGINVTIPASMTSAGGIGAPKRVLQFTAATAGTGRGYYAPTSSLALSNAPAAVAVGDVDGDGDLDRVPANRGAGSASL